MKKKIQALGAALVLSMGLGVFALAPVSYAACSGAANCINSGLKSTGGGSSKTDIGDVIKTVVNVLLFLVGSLSVIMIIVGGIKYTVSNGDSSSVSSAKNTIMYAVVGLLVSIFAYAIVNFVVTRFI